MQFDLSNLPAVEKQYYLQQIVAPRPICFASTIDTAGHVNLSPFSFFNVFSAQPPIVIFSPARRVRDNTTKHTLENVQQVPEVVIHMVTEDMVQQQSLASCEFPRAVNEFVKAGFTQEPATRVRPPMIKECKVKMECRVQEIKPLGTEGGAGNLVICEVLVIHIDDSLLDQHKKMDPRQLPLVARLGGDWYTVVNEQSLFQVAKPNTQLGMGIDALPVSVRNSRVFSGNDLGQLANCTRIPDIDPGYDDAHLKQIIQYFSINPEEMENELHRYAKERLQQGDVQGAWQILLAG
ncbi:MAG: flavin reductase family protein [Chitinophagia bacterium]|jgi:flavin reductase (DIM6/NTAB) family NADH-FMN oxidoreductase RutF|nr:flavin reductase family protein [Chitinophagia bacterium]